MTAVGIDVSKAMLDLAFNDAAKVHRFRNTPAGIRRLVELLGARPGVRIVLEATGGYEEAVLDACAEAGLWIARINPRQARDFARAAGQLAKTDNLDARMLAEMASVFQSTALALLPELGLLSRQQIAKLVGVAPLNRDSGKTQGKRQIYAGRSEMRVALTMATLSAVRWDPILRAHYQQLRARGKLAKVALVACMRKLLTIVNARRRDELQGVDVIACAA